MNIQKHNPDLYDRIITAVAKDNPENLIDIQTKLTAYKGRASLLDKFLKLFDSDNPYQAANNGRIIVAKFNATTEDYSKYGIKESESGTSLKNQLFVFKHKYNSNRMWGSGKQAILQIIQEFGSDSQQAAITKEGQKRNIESKKNQTKNCIDNLPTTIDDLLQANSISQKQKAQVHAILGLDEELKRLLNNIDILKYSGREYSNHLRAAEKGGELFGWFKRQIESLPTAIKDIYENLTSPYTEFNTTEERFMIGALIAYSAANRLIHRDAILGSYKQDFDFIQKLPKDHWIIQKHGELDLTKVNHILNSEIPITMIDAARVFDSYAIDRVRLDINKKYNNQFKEFDDILNELEPLFKENGRWKEEQVKSGIAMTELKETVYYNALVSDDFKAIKEALTLETLSNKDDYYKTLSILEFKSMTDKVVVAARKLKHMKNLQKKGIKYLKDSAIRGKNYDLVENFETEQGFGIEYLLDVMKNTQNRYNKNFQKKEENIKKNAAWGLYKKDKYIQEFADIVKGHVPRDEKLWLEFIGLKNNPLVISTPDLVKKEYFTLEENKEIITAIESKNNIKRPSKIHLNLIKNLEAITLYDGNGLDIVEKRLQLPSKDINNIKVIDTTKLDAAHQQTFENYSKPQKNWSQTMQFLSGYDAKSLLKRLDKQKISMQTWEEFRGADSQAFFNVDYIQKTTETYNKINDLKGKSLEPNKKYSNSDLWVNFNAELTGASDEDFHRIRREITLKGEKEFSPFNKSRDGWETWTPFLKSQIITLSYKVDEYNEKYNTQLKLKVL